MDGIKYDGEKPRWDLMQWEPLEAVTRVLTFGAVKYDDDNWKRVPDARKRYVAAAFRHLVAYVKGEQLDPESGEHHLAHCICCLLFLMSFDNGDGENGN